VKIGGADLGIHPAVDESNQVGHVMIAKKAQ